METLRWAWKGITKRAGQKVLYAPSMPIGSNPLIAPLLDKASTIRAKSHDLVTGRVLFPDGTFISLPQMCKQETPSALDTRLYYQLRAACKARFEEFPKAPPTLTTLENTLSTPSPRKLITRIYSITQQDYPITKAAAKIEWE